MVSYILIVVDVNVVVGGVVAFELFLLLAKIMTVRETSNRQTNKQRIKM